MAYDEKLASRVRAVLEGRADEKKMFGGIAFMVGGHMCCGIVKDDLMVRVGPQRFDEALARAHVRPMDFTGRPSKGMVYVSAEGVRSESSLAEWVERAVTFARSLPPKTAKKKTARKRRAS